MKGIVLAGGTGSRLRLLTVLLGNETLICPDSPDRVKKSDVLILADKRTHLLLELSYEDLPTYRVDDVIFRLQLQGFIPVLTHVKRYAYVGSDWCVLDRTTGDDLAQDPMDRDLVACIAT